MCEYVCVVCMYVYLFCVPECLCINVCMCVMMCFCVCLCVFLCVGIRVYGVRVYVRMCALTDVYEYVRMDVSACFVVVLCADFFFLCANFMCVCIFVCA